MKGGQKVKTNSIWPGYALFSSLTSSLRQGQEDENEEGDQGCKELIIYQRQFRGRATYLQKEFVEPDMYLAQVKKDYICPSEVRTDNE